MNFDERYSDAEQGFETLPGKLHSMIVKLGYDGPEPCWVCGTPTTWYSISFEAPTCSEECDAQAWSDFIKVAQGP